MLRDGHYIIDICDRVLDRMALREHRFDFFRGDPGARHPRGVSLPVDAFYEDLRLVVEYCERQHTEVVPFFDRRMTVSSMGRAEQRRRYDQRRREVLPIHGITLVELHFSEFVHGRLKRLTRVAGDEAVIRARLASWIG
jgi:hypothetical protein